MIRQRSVRKSLEKGHEVAGADPECNPMKARRRPRCLRLSLEQRQFGVSIIAGDHEWPALISRPLPILRNDLQTQDALVPISRLVPVRHKQLNVIDLEDAEASHPRDPRLLAD